MTSEYTWAPLVFARTRNVDYRLIAAPDDFGEREIAWVMPYILGTFEAFTSEDNPPALRWSVLKKVPYCVVGLTCMAYQLPTEKFQDTVGRRSLQAFLGYVSHRNSRPIEPLPPMLIEENLKELHGSPNKPEYGPFSELYELVEKHWDDAIRESREVDRRPYSYNLPSGRISDKDAYNWYLNTHDGKYKNEVMTWHPRENALLWDIASIRATWFSLCLGLSHKSIAQQGPFVNASAYDSKGRRGNPEILLRTYHQPANRASSKENAPRSSDHPQSIPHQSTQKPDSNPVSEFFKDTTANILGSIGLLPDKTSSDTQESTIPKGGLYRDDHPITQQPYKTPGEKGTGRPPERNMTGKPDAGFKKIEAGGPTPGLKLKRPKPSLSKEATLAGKESPAAEPDKDQTVIVPDETGSDQSSIVPDEPEGTV